MGIDRNLLHPLAFLLLLVSFLLSFFLSPRSKLILSAFPCQLYSHYTALTNYTPQLAEPESRQALFRLVPRSITASINHCFAFSPRTSADATLLLPLPPAGARFDLSPIPPCLWGYLLFVQAGIWEIQLNRGPGVGLGLAIIGPLMRHRLIRLIRLFFPFFGSADMVLFFCLFWDLASLYSSGSHPHVGWG